VGHPAGATVGSTSFPTVTVLGVPVDRIDESSVACWLDDQLVHAHVCRHIVTYNPEYAIAARRNPAFMQAIRSADLVAADGIGISLAARLRRGDATLPRVTGVEIVRLLAAASERTGAPIFLLGADPGVAPAAAARLQERAPGAQFGGWWWAGTPKPQDDAEAIERISASGARIVAVAYGAPGQVLWIERNRSELGRAGVRIVIGVGGALDYWAGTAKLAPPLVRKLGFEWLYRLMLEPWRWRRQLVLPVFALHATIEAAKTWLPGQQSSR
jgi:N-acetylglucosaminyldiphosphoundecaprenol N-acetyl-beta-D-mannosaminyltransferase